MCKDIDIHNFEYIDPNPASIIESLRSIGYTLETAIADLIDNSITANAKTISIDSPFNGSETKIFILDDGDGMDEQTYNPQIEMFARFKMKSSFHKTKRII